jgi:hypothetical protein
MTAKEDDKSTRMLGPADDVQRNMTQHLHLNAGCTGGLAAPKQAAKRRRQHLEVTFWPLVTCSACHLKIDTSVLMTWHFSPCHSASAGVTGRPAGVSKLALAAKVSDWHRAPARHLTAVRTYLAGMLVLTRCLTASHVFMCAGGPQGAAGELHGAVAPRDGAAVSGSHRQQQRRHQRRLWRLPGRPAHPVAGCCFPHRQRQHRVSLLCLLILAHKLAV